MKSFVSFMFVFFAHITIAAATASDVRPFDSDNSEIEENILAPSGKSILLRDDQARVDIAPHIDLESAQVDTEKAREAYFVRQDDENARLKQFMFTGLACFVRAAAIIQIANAQYHNKFGTALKAAALLQILYGSYLLLEPMHKLCTQKDIEIESGDILKKSSEMSVAKNYALTGLGYFISGIEGVLFARAAPDDPLAPFATLFGAEQLFVGAISCAYPGCLMFKDKWPLNKCFLNNEALLYQLAFPEEATLLKEKKLERSRLQQSLNIGISHVVRGGVAFCLAHAMPSQQYSDVLMTCGAFELLYALYALYDPFASAYHYLNGVNNMPTIEEGSTKLYILKAGGFIVSAPVNIMYTLGVPDAKTPWIVSLSVCSVLIGVYSGWHPMCDYYGLESLKCRKSRITPA